MPTDKLSLKQLDRGLSSEQRAWRWRVLTATYFGYAGYYLTRKIFTICKTSLAEEFNVGLDSIAHIWREGSIFKEIRDKIPSQMKGICGKCLFKHQCLGFCRADLLFDERPLLDSYGICNQMFQKGLFPESRILSETDFLKIDGNRKS